MHHNRLGKAGTSTYSDLKSGDYRVSVVAGEYVETRRLTLDSPPVSGSDRRRLTEHAERDQGAAWSPDGGRIAFVSQREGTWPST